MRIVKQVWNLIDGPEKSGKAVVDPECSGEVSGTGEVSDNPE